jgi:hypothetical protein
MLRNSKFDAEEIEREKGVIVEEMNMYFDTPRDFIGGVYDELLIRRPAARLDIIGRKETVRVRDARDVLDYIGPAGTAGAMVVGIGGRSATEPTERLEELLGDLERRPRRPRRPLQRRAARREGHTKQSDQAHISSASEPAARDPTGTYVLSSRPCSAAGCRRALHRGARARGSPTTSSHELRLHRRGSLYAQAGVDINRIDDAVTTIVDELERIVASRCPRTSSRRRRTSPRAASCSSSRARRD